MSRLSIRAKICIAFSMALALIAGLTAMLVILASRTVIRGTVRDYLVSAVEENVNKIRYVESRGDTEANFFLDYSDGYLEVDRDFMDVVNNVNMALYSSEGEMLYGENPLS